jgi:uncharacterized cupredoxin-like copper-binding protein
MKYRHVAVTMLAALVLVACGGGGGAAEDDGGDDTSGSGGGSTLDVTATEFKFDPAALTAVAGEDLTIKLVNGGVVEHDFTIDALGIKILVKVGETGEDTAENVAAGSYEVYCAIAGHKEAGMVGTLEVQ